MSTSEGKNLYIETYGCQMNEYDSDRIRTALGMNLVDDPEHADVVIINTCAIRAKADHKAFSSLGRLKHLKSRKPGMVIGVGGCVAQLYGKKLLEDNPHLDLVFGTRNIPSLPRLIEEVARERIVETSFDVEDIFDFEPYHEDGKITGFVSVQSGCNKKCTYCIVPTVRGGEVNRPLEDILSEAGSLVAKGAKEITLIGQTVNSWKHDGKRFADLLRRVAEIVGLLRLRFTTSYPRDMTKGVIEAIRDTEKICHHIHLPVQSGSNKVLKAMGRTYTREWYTDVVSRLRDAVPDIAISTDIIVGFPGETEEDFGDTMKLVEEIQFDSSFSFKFSPRPGTPAAQLAGALPDDVAGGRLRELQALQSEITYKKNRQRVGEVEEVLVEGYSKMSPFMVSGRTTHNRIVNFPGDINLKGKLARVKITEGFQNSLLGQFIETI
ncbi:MAG: tRNA (N6-isopentenyl adenosine(37)-C2)-methylthiotransferase MiaB [Candidatus Methanosuratincola sp.]